MDNFEFQWNAELYQGTSSPQYRLGLMALERLSPSDGEHLLDIGCGNAVLTIELAKLVPHGLVTGIELSGEMLRKAADNLSGSRVTNVRLMRMNALDIRFNSEFDGIFSNSAIHWIDDLESMYRLLFKALKPGGRIMIQTSLREMNPLMAATLAVQDDERFRGHLGGTGIPWRFNTEEENRLILTGAGFSEIAVEPHVDAYKFGTREELSGYLESAPMVPLLSRLPGTLRGEFARFFVDAYLEKNFKALDVVTTRAFISAVRPA